MSRRFQFENFSPKAGGKDPNPESGPSESQAVESFENGYKAGWDDAVKVQQDEGSRVKTDLAQNLQSIAFTAEDARAHMLTALRPVLEEMVDSVLPEASRATLGQTILDIIQPMLDAATDPTMHIVVHPDDRADVSLLIDQIAELPVTIVDEDTVGAGQAFLRIGGQEKSIDMAEVLVEMRQAVEAFYSTRTSDPADLQEGATNVG